LSQRTSIQRKKLDKFGLSQTEKLDTCTVFVHINPMMNLPRVIEIPDLAPEQRVRRPRCTLADCDQPTHEQKPFCTDHVERHPYAVKVLAEINARSQEQQRVKARGWRAVDLTGSTARDLLLELRLRGKRTTPRLSRDLVLPESVVAAYVMAFAKKGWVLLGETARGISLVCPEAIPAAADLEHAASQPRVSKGGRRRVARTGKTSASRASSDSAA
jgi:hypothetical protein